MPVKTYPYPPAFAGIHAEHSFHIVTAIPRVQPASPSAPKIHANGQQVRAQ